MAKRRLNIPEHASYGDVMEVLDGLVVENTMLREEQAARNWWKIGFLFVVAVNAIQVYCYVIILFLWFRGWLG